MGVNHRSTTVPAGNIIRVSFFIQPTFPGLPKDTEAFLSSVSPVSACVAQLKPTSSPSTVSATRRVECDASDRTAALVPAHCILSRRCQSYKICVDGIACFPLLDGPSLPLTFQASLTRRGADFQLLLHKQVADHIGQWFHTGAESFCSSKLLPPTRFGTSAGW